MGNLGEHMYGGPEVLILLCSPQNVGQLSSPKWLSCSPEKLLCSPESLVYSPIEESAFWGEQRRVCTSGPPYIWGSDITPTGGGGPRG